MLIYFDYWISLRFLWTTGSFFVIDFINQNNIISYPQKIEKLENRRKIDKDKVISENLKALRPLIKFIYVSLLTRVTRIVLNGGRGDA